MYRDVYVYIPNVYIYVYICTLDIYTIPNKCIQYILYVYAYFIIQYYNTLPNKGALSTYITIA